MDFEGAIAEIKNKDNTETFDKCLGVVHNRWR